jgi:hypothetical protein
MVRDTDGRGPPLMRLTTNRAAPTFLLSPFVRRNPMTVFLVRGQDEGGLDAPPPH